MKKTIIGLVGETGSGKDTVANYLQEKYGATLMRFADPIKEVLGVFFDRASKQDQQWLYLTLKDRFGEDILGKALGKKVAATSGLIVINGLRMPVDYDFLKNLNDSHILYVTANQKLRWQRVKERGEKSDDNVDLEKFQEIERAETEVHIPEIGAKADFRIENDQDFNHLIAETEKIMEKIMK